MNKLIALFGIVLLLGAGLVSAHGETEETYDGHHDGMMNGIYGTNMIYGYGFGWLIMALVIILLVLLIVWLIKQLTQENRRKR